jgi:hypothetical protein
MTGRGSRPTPATIWSRQYRHGMASFFAHHDPPRKLRADARDLLTRCYTEAV